MYNQEQNGKKEKPAVSEYKKMICLTESLSPRLGLGNETPKYPAS